AALWPHRHEPFAIRARPTDGFYTDSARNSGCCHLGRIVLGTGSFHCYLCRVGCDPRWACPGDTRASPTKNRGLDRFTCHLRGFHGFLPRWLLASEQADAAVPVLARFPMDPRLVSRPSTRQPVLRQVPQSGQRLVLFLL